MTTEADNQHLYELNCELLETIVVITKRFVDYAKKYDMRFCDIESLVNLVGRAQAYLEEIRTPYTKNPVISDAFIHPKPSDKDYTAPQPRFC